MPELSVETERILAAVRAKQSFVLSGGAGSGKTYTLQETIRELDRLDPSIRIACITYTNAAADEIKERVETPGLWISTIHDFLWAHIEQYQNELKCQLTELLRSEDPAHRLFTLPDGMSPDCELFEGMEEGIRYREYVRIREGIISHDEVLVLAERMFACYPKLCRLICDLFPYILVDEYQDTSPLVISILDAIRKESPHSVVGFFGDAMQAIYDGTVGSLQDRIDREDIVEIKKEQNRRNPRRVIELANKIRTDGLVQHPSNDVDAPNMLDGQVREGYLQFLYSRSASTDDIRAHLDWNDGDAKELNLTHNLIAKRAGFENLMEVYDGDKILDFVDRIRKHIKINPADVITEGKTFGEVVRSLQEGKSGRELKQVKPTDGMQAYIDQHSCEYNAICDTPYDNAARLFIKKDHLLDDATDGPDRGSGSGSERDELIKHLFRIQNCVRMYEARQYGEFINVTDFKLQSIEDKATLQKAIDGIADSPTSSIGEVIDNAAEAGLVLKGDRLLRFQEEKSYLYNRVSRVQFSEFQCLYNYLEGHTPFSTQHKTKGRQFAKVLVVLDNGGWSNYNFKQLFEGGGKESVMERTRKLFYVCCTRAMEHLVVYYHNPTDNLIAKAQEWFGAENVVDLDA